VLLQPATTEAPPIPDAARFCHRLTKPLNIQPFYAILRCSRQYPETAPAGSVAFYFQPTIKREY
jgi:hypothetical protein